MDDKQHKLSGRGRLMRWGAWLLAVGGFAAHLQYGHAMFSSTARICLGLFAALTALAFGYAPRGTVPALAVALGMLYLALGVPGFYPVRSWTVRGPVYPSHRAIEQAAQGVLLYVVVMSVFAALVSWIVRRSASRFEGRWASVSAPSAHGARLALALALAGLGLLGRFVSLGSLAQPIGLLTHPVIVLGLLMWNARSSKSSGSRLALLGVAAFMFVTSLTSGMLGGPLQVLFVLGVVSWRLRGEPPLLAGAVALALMLVLGPIKGEYRAHTWGGTVAMSSGEKLELWASLFWRHYMGDYADTTLDDATDVTSSRLSTFPQVAQIYDAVPRQLPHDGPDQWLTTPLLLVPRALWPDKPVQEHFFNKRYTHTFRLQSSRYSRGTSITLPAVGDGYWRLGTLGVVIEALLLGAFVGFAQGVGYGVGLPSLLVAAILTGPGSMYHTFGLMMGWIQSIGIVLGLMFGLHLWTRTGRSASSPHPAPVRRTSGSAHV